MSDSGTQQTVESNRKAQAMKRSAKTRKGSPRKAPKQASPRKRSSSQHLPQQIVLETPPERVQQSQNMLQPTQTEVQSSQTLFQPYQTVNQHQQTYILQPSQTVAQTPQAVLHPLQAMPQPSQTVIQPQPVVFQPPHPGSMENNNPPQAPLVQCTPLPNIFCSPLLNNAVQPTPQHSASSSLGNSQTSSQTSTMTLLNALHDEKLGLLLPVMVRMEHKMDQLIALMGQVGNQLNALMMANQSKASVMANQSRACMVGNRQNSARMANQSDASVMVSQENAVMVGNQSNISMMVDQSSTSKNERQSNFALTDSQSNSSAVEIQSNATEVSSGTRELNHANDAVKEFDLSLVTACSTATGLPSESMVTRGQLGGNHCHKEKVSKLDLSDDSNFPLSREVVISLHAKSNSTMNFAVHLLRELFTLEELEGKNISGSRGKDKVDPKRVEIIKDVVFKTYSTVPSERETVWRYCRKAMDAFMRRMKREKVLKENSRQENVTHKDSQDRP